MTPQQAEETQLLSLFAVALGDGAPTADEADEAARVLASDAGIAYRAAREQAAQAVAARQAADDAARAAQWAAHADRLLGARPGVIRSICPRCSGRGILEQFRHRSGGACFRCSGAGYLS